MSGPLFEEGSLSEELDARVRSELHKGERLIWSGRPTPGAFARQSLPIVLFGVVWTAFSLFWMAGASGVLFGGGVGRRGAFDVLFPLFGLPFVLVGLAMLGSPYWLRRRSARTCYALTDRRAILWEAGWFGSVEIRTYRPADLAKLFRVEYRGGGDLVFEEQLTVGRNSDGGTTTSTKRHGFLGIADVREVEDLLRNTLLPDEEAVDRS